jgi:hypothetical protein
VEEQWAADAAGAEFVGKRLLLCCASRMLEGGMGCHDTRKEKRRYWYRRAVGMDGVERWMMDKEVEDERVSKRAR